MSYAAAVEHLYSLGQELSPAAAGAPRRKYDLAHMRALVSALGNPQSNFASVLVAGTNGKGSTAATLASILTAAGYRTALYTSPHLIRVNERIQVSVPVLPSEYSSAGVRGSSGRAHLVQISDEEFARHYFAVDEAALRLVRSGVLPQTPSFFETMTALAFCYFAEKKVEIAVLEVGLGGRLDATNIVEPVISIITDIALDHQDYLGSTLGEIAREKAGILRPGGTLVTLPQHPEVNQVFGEVAAELEGLRAVSAVPFMPARDAGLEESRSVPAPAKPRAQSAHPPDEVATPVSTMIPSNHYKLTWEGESVEIASPLAGQHQQRNLALALSAASELSNQHGYKIAADAIREGIRSVIWPGRLQEVALPGDRKLLLDVAHNPAGAWVLRSALSRLDSAQPRTLLFSCLRDKNLDEMAKILFPLFDSSSSDTERNADHVLLTRIDNPRAVGLSTLLETAERLKVPAQGAPSAAAALAQALAVTPTGGLIVATGSVYLVGEVLGSLKETA